MTLPSFIGIGTERSGSTWLHQLLQEHPQIYMPTKRKELNFFDKNYDKGLDWYQSFFPLDNASSYRAIGEITPSYMHHPESAARVAALGSIQKFIVILRNPVERAYSAYGHYVRLRNYQDSFEAYLQEFPKAINFSLYADKIEKYFEYFDRTQLCCLIFEQSVRNAEATKHRLANFLEVDFDQFPATSGQSKVKETYLPKFKRLNRIATKFRTQLIKADADWVVLFFKRLGFKKILTMGGQAKAPKLSDDLKQKLYQDFFQADVDKLEQLLNINLDVWRYPVR